MKDFLIGHGINFGNGEEAYSFGVKTPKGMVIGTSFSPRVKAILEGEVERQKKMLENLAEGTNTSNIHAEFLKPIEVAPSLENNKNPKKAEEVIWPVAAE